MTCLDMLKNHPEAVSMSLKSSPDFGKQLPNQLKDQNVYDPKFLKSLGDIGSQPEMMSRILSLQEC